MPERLIGDKACDSDKLDERLAQNHGTEMIAPGSAAEAACGLVTLPSATGIATLEL